MDNKTIFTKTAKGLSEAVGKTKALPREMRDILKEIDGTSSVEELASALDLPVAKLQETLAKLDAGDYIHEFVPPTVAEEDDLDLDFRHMPTGAPADPLMEVTIGAFHRASEEQAEEEAREKERLKTAVAKIRQEALDKYHRDLEERAKQETEEKRRREAETKARREAEERARIEAAERARREAEERSRREAELEAQRAAEERARALAAEEARRAAEETTRRRAEEEQKRQAERERQLAEELARKEAEEEAAREARRREAEEEQKRQAERERQLAEERARKEAEEAAAREAKRREAEEEQKRKAERERQLAEERARKKAEEEAAKEAKRRAAEEERQRKAERERIAAEERARKEAEAAAKKEAEKQARREAKARAKKEAEERARQKAEEKARREEEKRREREAAEQARRAAEEKSRQEAAERAEQEQMRTRTTEQRTTKPATVWRTEEESEERIEPAESSVVSLPGGIPTEKTASASFRKPIKWKKPVAIAVSVLAVVSFAIALTMSYDGKARQFEALASAQFQQPVKIESVRLALLPLPHWRIEKLVIGQQGQIKVKQVDILPHIDALFDDKPVYKSVALTSPIVTEEGLGWLMFSPASQRSDFRFQEVTASGVQLFSAAIELPPFNVHTFVGADGNWKRMLFDSEDGNVHAELRPQDGTVQVNLSADALVPPFGTVVGTSLKLDNFQASGNVTLDRLALTKFSGKALNGLIDGSAVLKWGTSWRLEGDLKATEIDTPPVAPQLLEGGKLDGSGTYAMEAPVADELFSALHLNGRIKVRDGTLLGVNLANVLRGVEPGGKSPFSELESELVRDQGRIYLRNLHVRAGMVSASGSAGVDNKGRLSGRFAVDLKTPTRQKRAYVGLDGTVDVPRFHH